MNLPRIKHINNKTTNQNGQQFWLFFIISIQQQAIGQVTADKKARCITYDRLVQENKVIVWLILDILALINASFHLLDTTFIRYKLYQWIKDFIHGIFRFWESYNEHGPHDDMVWCTLIRIYRRFRLSKAGHEITVLEANTNPKVRELGANITVHHIYIPPAQGIAQYFARNMWEGSVSSTCILPYYVKGNEVAKDFLRDYSEKMVQILGEKWDCIIVDELFATHAYAIATFFKEKENVPYITISTTIMNPPAAEKLALGEFVWEKWV